MRTFEERLEVRLKKFEYSQTVLKALEEIRKLLPELEVKEREEEGWYILGILDIDDLRDRDHEIESHTSFLRQKLAKQKAPSD